MKRNLIILILLFLLFSIAFGLIYLNNVYLPIKAKDRLINTLETNLNYNTEIQKLKYNLFKGLIIQNIVIYDKTKENTILNIKEISFNFLFIPLIRERKIIIPIIHVNSPYMYIRYQKDNKFNFSRIFSPKSKKPSKQKIKFSFLVYRINIFDGQGTFEDEHFEPKFTKTIQDLDIGLALSPFLKVSFLIQTKLLPDKGGITKLSAQGEYNFQSREINAKLNFANLIIPEFNPYLKMLPLTISSGTIENTDLDLNFKDKNIRLKGIIYTKTLELKKEKLSLLGDINIESELNYALEKRKLDYKTNFKFIQASLSDIPYIEKLNIISGNIDLIKDKLFTDNLKLKALDSEFLLKGSLENFLSPYLKLNFASSQFKLENLLSILPHPEGLSLSGVSTANIDIEGNLKKLPLNTKADFIISQAMLKMPILKEPINNISGNLNLTLNSADWMNLSFNYLNTIYTSEGKLINFKEPQVNFGLNSSDLDLKSGIKIKDKFIRINAFKAKYVDSNFDVNGNIDIKDTNNPLLDLALRLDFNPKDVLVFLPANLAENIKKIKLDSKLNITGSFKGRTKDYRDWVVSTKIVSDSLSLYNLKFNNLSFNLEQKDGTLNITGFSASGYSGRINLEFNSNLKATIPVYTLKLNTQGIDLTKLKLDTDLKDKEIAGILDINADLGGDFKELSTLKGSGFISIKDGKIWQINLFKGLGELFLLPDYEKVVFKDAIGEFNIEDKSIFTENLRLTSEQINLDCKGKLGFDGALDFTVYTQVNKNLIKDSTDIRKFTAAILGELGKAIVIKVSGSIKEPKYNLVPMPLDLIKSIKDFFLGK